MFKTCLTAALLLAAAGLAGCQAATVEEPRPRANAAMKDWDHRLAPHAKDPTPNQEEEVARRSEPADEPPEIDANPEQLMGLASSRLGDLLGPPAQLRREPPAEVWQYRVDGCVLDLFLYDEADERRVVHLEARDQSMAPADAEACLEDLLRRHMARQVS